MRMSGKNKSLVHDHLVLRLVLKIFLYKDYDIYYIDIYYIIFILCVCLCMRACVCVFHWIYKAIYMIKNAVKLAVLWILLQLKIKNIDVIKIKKQLLKLKY